MKHWQISLAIIAALSASLALADDFKTVAGKEYKNATVSRVEPDGIVIKFHGGIAKIFFVELPPEIQKKYGYDPEAEMQQKAREATKQNAQAADLMSQAESALRTGQFEKGAELLNQIVSDTLLADRRRLSMTCAQSFVKKQTQSGPFTASEAQRLGSLMEALANIKKDYRTATPEKRHDLEAVFGAETFRDTDNGLDSVLSSSRKLRDSIGKARGEY